MAIEKNNPEDNSITVTYREGSDHPWVNNPEVDAWVKRLMEAPEPEPRVDKHGVPRPPRRKGRNKGSNKQYGR